MQRLTIIDSIVNPAKTVNEDLFDHNEQAAWIFDGASGIAKDTIPGAASDPHWLVHTMNQELKRVWDDAKPTRALLRLAAESVIARYNELVSPLPPLHERPTACFTMARIWKGKMEISSLGDTGMLYTNDHKTTLHGCVVYPAAEPVRNERKRLLAAGTPIEDLLAVMLPLHIEFRSKANVDGGYDIMDTTTRWVDRIAIQTIEAQPGDRLLLLSDGFYRLVELFQKYSNHSLVEAALTQSLTTLYDELRMLEMNDAACTAYPRAKVSDDVATALLSVS